MTSSSRPTYQKKPSSSSPPQIAGHQPVADELVARRLRLVPVAQEHDRVRPVDGDRPDGTGRHHIAPLIDHLDPVAGNRPPHRAGAEAQMSCCIADDEVAFGLAVELVDRDAEHRPAPLQQLSPQRLAAAGDRAEIQPLPRNAGPAHQLERGRRQEDVAHAMALHQRHRLVRVELAEPVRQHRHAMMPGRHQHVEQPADPRPVRRSPEQVARLREELMRQLHAGQMPEQHPMRMQRALRAARSCRRCR